MMTRLTTLAALALTLIAGRAAAAKTHTVTQGDHLWNLARHYYTDNFKWRRIYQANTNVVEDPHWIYPGEVLVIPDFEEADVDLGPAEAPDEASAPLPPQEDEEPAAVAPSRPTGSLGAGGTDGIDLSKAMPPAVTGHFNTMARVKAAKGWREDGAIIEFEGREIMTSAGDVVAAKLKSPASPGDRFTVYRRAAVQEQDEDQKAKYLQRVGFVEVKEAVSSSRYRLVILKSADAVQLGDLLKKED